jgi:hypothetical protein
VYTQLTTPRSYVFRWLAIPWLQAELDRWVLLRNQTAPRRDRNKILPHGIPELIRRKPDQYGSADFQGSIKIKNLVPCYTQVIVPLALFDEIETLYAPPDHPVFELVPPPFGN